MGWSLEAASVRHIGPIARAMREIDVREVQAFGHTPRQALRLGLRASSFALTALTDGRPVAMMGLVVGSYLAGAGRPWMLGTDEVSKGARRFLEWGPRVVAMMQEETPMLENHVGAENRLAKRMLARLGFEIDSEVAMIGGMAFQRFRRRHV